MSGYNPPDVHSRPLFDDGVRHLARRVGKDLQTWCGTTVPRGHKDPTPGELEARGIWTLGNCHCCHRAYRLAHNAPTCADLNNVVTLNPR